jgi:hypothetical protein
MNKWKGPQRRLAFFALTLLISLSVGVVVLSKKKQEPKIQKHAATTFKAELANSLPQVSSRVKGLEIAGVSIINQGTSKAALAINIVNKSDDPVVSLEITSGDANDFSNLGLDGLGDPLHPQVQIEPHTLKTIEWRLAEILEGYPVVISAATFGNGKEEGDSRDIEMMRHDRVRSQTKREAASKKEGPDQ